MTESVDLDRLADYVGGALDGTPDADAVAQLIADDPRWAAAASALGRADALVRADLGAFAATSQPMPADVAARIDAALASAPPGLSVIRSEQAMERTDASMDRRRRARRWTAVAAVAAAVVALGFGVVSVLPTLARHDNKTAAPQAGLGANRQEGSAQDSAAGAPPAAASGGLPRVVSSGTNYRPDTLWALSSRGGVPAAPGESDKSLNRTDAGTAGTVAPVPPELRRLQDQDALKACLGAITAEYGGSVTLVDYARFEGRPALLVLLAGANRRTGLWAVVVGPNCGQGGAIADELFNGPAG